MRLMVNILLFVLLAVAIPSTDYIDKTRNENQLPALFAGRLLPNRTFTGHVTGVRRQGSPALATTDDAFHLGSNTKAMTSTLIARHIEQGNWTWETTIAQALPGQQTTISEKHRNVTLAQLAAHRSGFPADGTLGDINRFISLKNVSAVQGRQIYLDRVFRNSSFRDSGKFEYSNINYIILGYIIDKAYGPWEQIVQTQLWQPLNMTGCGFGNFPSSFSVNNITGLWPHLETANESQPFPPTWEAENPPMLGPAGTVRCSPSSYAHFLALHLDGAKGLNTPILKAESFKRLHTPYDDTSTDLYTVGEWNYLAPRDRQQQGSLLHDGRNTINFAETVLVPGTDSGYMVLTNQGSTEVVLAKTKTGRAVGAVTTGFGNGNISELPVLGKGALTTNGTRGPGPVPRGTRNYSMTSVACAIMLALFLMSL